MPTQKARDNGPRPQWFDELLDKWIPGFVHDGPRPVLAAELAASWRELERTGYSEDAAKGQVRRMQRLYPGEWNTPSFYGRALGYLKKLRAEQLKRERSAA